ncbi:MAG: molecular chaperone HtpG [Oscillospiraceae bacterium]|jgi:molecular chaperone HtpG|nr:molecular chaperone HtpG [Oscillospiraceae bacterium]
MAKRQFKTESRRILDLMINSVYTHKEIFLRELISNASDAIDKLYFRSLTDDSVPLTKDDYRIEITLDKDARALKITDNGCGMDEDALNENLGVIAHSGTAEFGETLRERGESLPAEENQAGDTPGVRLVGQFGVGFYSAFMVSKKVTVLSRAFGTEQAYLWESAGVEGYSVRAAEKASHGTEITLYIKDDADGERYGEFLEPYRVSGLIKKYSDYIRYPIVLDGETKNSMIPLWRKNRSELSADDYNGFYKGKFGDYEDPAFTIHYSTEGAVSYTALLFAPSQAPYNYYTRDYEKGLQLYANGVLIMDKCADLLPDHFSFIRGLADSPDLSLNISREMLQHDRQLKAMAKSVEKKIRAELERMLENEREKYEAFYKAFGLQMKYGLYSGFGTNADTLKDLVLFHSLAEDRPVTFKEYVEKMPEGQEHIYYVCAETPAKALLLPQTERLREKGRDILCLTEDVDEFALKMLREYDGKEFRSVSGGDVGLTDEEKEAQKTRSEENKDLLAFIGEALGEKVSGVTVSARLGRHAVCLTSEGELSIEMEKVLNQMPAEHKVKARRVLELNAGHAVFAALRSLFVTDRDRLRVYANLLYSQALLIEGLPVDDPVAFSEDICSLMKA